MSQDDKLTKMLLEAITSTLEGNTQEHIITPLQAAVLRNDILKSFSAQVKEELQLDGFNII